MNFTLIGCNKSMVAGRILPIFIGLLVLTACQQRNSFSTDQSTYGTTNVSGSVAFISSLAILKTNCATCHEHTQYSTYSEQDFISNGVIAAGNSAGSDLFQHLNGSGVAGAQDMPQGAAALPTDQILTIKTWIDGISP